jgi:hypothetical protein
MLLCHFKFLCLVDLLLIYYVLWQVAKGFLSSQHITESKKLVTYDVGCLFTALSHIKPASTGTSLIGSSVRTVLKEGHCMSTVHLNNMASAYRKSVVSAPKYPHLYFSDDVY